MFTLRESTRWLTKKGRHDEAWESLKWIRADESQATIEEMEEIRMGVEIERRATEGLHPKGKTSVSPIRTYRLSVYRTFRTRQLQTACHRINCLHSATSYWCNCFRLLWTTIFQASRWRWFVLFLSDRIGRRKVLIAGAAFMAACQITTAAVVKNRPAPGEGKVKSSGIATVALIYLFVIAYNLSWGPLPWPYVSE
jgi:hypothetical protein